MDRRSFTIKVDVCWRILKDWKYYIKDKANEEMALTEYRANNSPQVRQQEQVLGETIRMIGDAKNRSQDAYETLLESMQVISDSESRDVFMLYPEWERANDFIRLFTDDVALQEWMEL